jgi:cytochrome c
MTMKLSLIATAALFALTAPAFAGDAVKGEKEFKKCKACHAIVADDGTEIVKGGKVGPNLYGVVGRAAGGVEDFNYSDVMKESGVNGLIWDETTLTEYLPDPSAFLEAHSGDAKGKSKMSFKLKKGGEDVAAYLASVVPAAN